MFKFIEQIMRSFHHLQDFVVLLLISAEMLINFPMGIHNLKKSLEEYYFMVICDSLDFVIESFYRIISYLELLWSDTFVTFS